MPHGCGIISTFQRRDDAFYFDFLQEGSMAAITKEKETTASFIDYPSSKKLKQLAEDPFDLTKPGNLTPQRLENFCAASCGYRLLYGTERVTKEVMQTLEQLSKESVAVNKMEKMQSGEIVNFIQGSPSENRPALHTATRDFFEHPNKSEKARLAAAQAKKEVDHLKAFMEKIDKENRFTDLIMIGIGGSDLGPRANYLALEYLKKPNRHVHFICNIDPDDAAAALRGVNLKNCLVLVISKTGTTLETCTNEAFVKARFEKAGLKPEEHFISVSSQGSPLDNPKKYLACFHIWDWVGGRYSSSSMVGGVLLSFAFGFNVFWELLKGANAMDKTALNHDVNQNLPLLSALLAIWNRNFLNYPTLAIIPYAQSLWRYPAHIQQVEMESNGKRIDQMGKKVNFETAPVIWGEAGTNAQHSFYQLIHQGTEIVPLEMIGFKESQTKEDISFQGTTSQQKLLSNLFAQALGLATGQQDDNPNKVFPGNRPTHILLGKELTPFALGSLLAFFEHKAAFQGFIWGINSFDQEGVQLGKVLATKIIARFAGNAEVYPLGDALLKQLEKL